MVSHRLGAALTAVCVCVVHSRCAGKGEAIETTLAALQVVPEPFRSFANTLVDICAYAGQSGVIRKYIYDLCPPAVLKSCADPPAPSTSPYLPQVNRHALTYIRLSSFIFPGQEDLELQ